MECLTISANCNTCPELDATLDEHSTATSDGVAYEIIRVRELKQQSFPRIVGNINKTVLKDGRNTGFWKLSRRN